MAALAKSRDYSFDISKGLAIYLVVLGHLVTVSIIRIPIDFTHMPLFFFVSGWFFAKTFESDAHDGGTQFRRKARRLLVPFLVWSFIALLFNILLWTVSGGMQTASVLEYSAGQAVDIFFHLRSFWFLLVLFLTFCYLLICRFLAQKTKVNQYVIALIGWLILYVFVPDNYDASFLGLYKFEWLLPFFLAGSALKDTKLVSKARSLYAKHRVLISLCLVAVIALMYLFHTTSLFRVWEVPNVFAWDSPFTGFVMVLYYVLSLGAVVGLLVLSGRLAKTKACSWLSELGVYSLDVYVLHMFFVKAIAIVLPTTFLESPWYGYVVAPLLSLVIVVAIWAMVKFVLNRFKPYAILMRD